MDYTSLVGWTAAKIGIVLVVILTFAPVLIWAERRQSAMIQDRVGPHRAGLSSNVLGKFIFPGAMAAFTLWVILLAASYVRSRPEVSWGAYIPEDNSLITGLKEVGYILLWVGAIATTLLVGALAGVKRLYNGKDIQLAGLLHPLADALKLVWKEDFVPAKADRLLHALAPMVTLIPAVLAFAIIPFADVFYVDHAGVVMPESGVPAGAVGSVVPMSIADMNVGILFIFAVAGTGVIGAAIAGYASDNKYSLLGGIRAAGQMVSYEVALGLTLVPAFMWYGTLRLDEMVLQQANETTLGGLLPAWGIFNPLLWVPFILYATASIAETKRIPFDVPEGESELVGGYFTEYSGMKWGMFFMAEFIEVILLAALAATIFFGGWDVPFLSATGIDLPGTWQFTLPEALGGFIISDGLNLWHGVVILIQLHVFLLKIAVLIFLQLQIRWTLPRFRYDQIMALCWKYLLPLALVNILITGAAILFLEG